MTATIIETLIAERKRRGWSQREVVRQLGVSSSSVWNWERGNVDPTLGNLAAWAAVLGYSLALTSEAAS